MSSNEDGAKDLGIPLLRGKSHREKLQKRLSTHAFEIADATSTSMRDDEIYDSYLGQLWIEWFGRSEVISIVLPIFYEPAFRKRTRRWACVYLGSIILMSYLQVKATNVSLAVSSSVESMDGESFYSFLVMWFTVQAAMLVRTAVQTQSRWELRMMVQWRLQFRMGHALFSDSAFHHLQVGTFKSDLSADFPTNPAPEALLCRDSFVWLHDFSNNVDQLISELVAVVTTIYTVSKWSYLVTAYMLISVPFRAAITMRMMPKEQYTMHHKQLATIWELMFVMGRIQDNSEQIALLRGGAAELARFVSTLKILVKNNLAIVYYSNVQSVYITLMGTAFSFPIMVKLMYEVCDHGLTVSAAMTYCMQCAAVGMHLGILAGFSIHFVKYQQTVSNMTQMIRAGENIRGAARRREALGAQKDHVEREQILVGQTDPLDLEAPVVEMRNVTVWAPKANGGHGVFLGFNMRLNAGESLLIVGDTGVGKSALLRAIHGLWSCGSGRVERCHRSLLSCMPERPFSYTGTLRQNLLYPEVEDAEGITDETIMETLEALNLKQVATLVGLDHKAPWHSILSLGQQQRLGFARILLRPHIRIVLLDEATSALDMKNERNIYAMLRERFPCHVSVGHRPSVREYHTHVAVLRFQAERSFCTSEAQFMPIGDFDFDRLNEKDCTKLKGSSEEQLWAQRALEQAHRSLQEDKATDVKQAAEKDNVAPKEQEGQKEEQEEEVVLQSKPPTLINLERHWGGLSLLWRSLRDIIWPMLTSSEVVLPIFFVFGLSYAFSYINLAMEKWFGYPYAMVISVLQTRNSSVCWEFFFKTIIFYYPCQVGFGIISRNFANIQQIVCRVLIKWYLGKNYLDPKTDPFYHMTVARIVEGNPGSRISTWDADTANSYIVSLVSTLSTAVFGVWISGWSLYSMNKSAFGFFMFYIMGGAGFYAFMGYQVFKAYSFWLDLTTQLHTDVLHVREHSEAIALLQGSDVERRMAFEKMDQAVTPGSCYLWLKDCASFLGNTYFQDASDMILTALTGPMVLCGNLTFHGQTQMKGIIGAGSGGVQSMLTEMLLNVEGQVAMERIWELLATIRHIQGADRGKSRFGGDLTMEEDPDASYALELRNVCLRTPVSSGGTGGAYLLVEDVSLKVSFEDSLLIAGESGIGKSSMLRAVAGLWRHGRGKIRVTDDRKSFFIPQRPYVFVGNFRENLLYPETDRCDIDDDTLRYVANTVGLQHLLLSPGLGEYRKAIEERADVTTEHDKGWFWRLSLGELQRLNFARLLLREDVRLVFLDEATSALSIESEEAMYQLLKENVRSYISVAHRPQLRRFHQRAFVMLTDHSKPPDADCKTKCLLMSMEEYEKELGELAKVEEPSKDEAATKKA